MSKYRKKPVVIEAITFQELVEYGIENGGNVVNGMPWSFEYKGHAITQENEECYLIPTLEGTHNMTPKDMLITGVVGEIYPCKIDIFEATYEKEGQKLSFLQRLEDEEANLGSKIYGLSKALAEDGFHEKVGAYQYDLLSVQHSAMLAYRKVLIMRIENIRRQSETKSITSEVGPGDVDQKSPSEKA